MVIRLPSHFTSKTFESPKVQLTNEGEELGLVEIVGEHVHECFGVMNDEAAAVGHPFDDIRQLWVGDDGM
jgi:hypothetical protein